MNRSSACWIITLLIFFHNNGSSQVSTIYRYDNFNRLEEVKYNDGTIVKYFYDAVGNRSKNLISGSSLCPNNSTYFKLENIPSGSTYQWQRKKENGFINLTDNNIYLGSESNLLFLESPPTALSGTIYQCIVVNGIDTTIVGPFILRFTVTWLGKQSEAWENPTNWNCNTLPDANTDVIIPTGLEHYPVINSQALCNSIVVNETTSIKIASGFNLTVTSRQ